MSDRERLLDAYFRKSIECDEMRVEIETRKRHALRRKTDDEALVKMLADRLGPSMLEGSGPAELRHRVQCALDKLKADREVLERHWREFELQKGIPAGWLVFDILHGRRESSEVIADAIAGKAQNPTGP